jgi:branched-chain amino acid transport system substrate-binding protein
VVENHPDATVAVLYQNDAYGEDLLGGFEEAIEGSGVEIVERQSYETTDPDVSSQVGILAESGADVFLNITTPLFGAQAIAAVAQLDWDPVHLLNNVAASKTEVLEPVGLELAQGIISTAYFKDPDSPDWADDPAMLEYKEALAAYEPDADPNEAFNAYGWTAASTFVEALRQMEEPTRESLMEAVRNLDVEIPMLLPGITVRTDGTEDGYPIEAMQLQVFEGEH